MVVDSVNCIGKISGKPIKSYTTEAEAKKAEVYVKRIYSKNQVAYKCSDCKLWHLSPKEMHIDGDKSCGCTSSTGEPKNLYQNKKQAQDLADFINEQFNNLHLSIYPCYKKTGWHLTKNNQNL